MEIRLRERKTAFLDGDSDQAMKPVKKRGKIMLPKKRQEGLKQDRETDELDKAFKVLNCDGNEPITTEEFSEQISEDQKAVVDKKRRASANADADQAVKRPRLSEGQEQIEEKADC
jgi:hypothetical protein